MPSSRTSKLLSTADVRRDTVLSSAIAVFAKGGYLGTPVAVVAERAGISTAYVFKLFPSKESLFVAALERCFELIQEALAQGAEASADQTPNGLLSAMGFAYAGLISNRDLLSLQVHAQSAAEVPEVKAAFRSGLQSVTLFVKKRSGAADEEVQRFMAYGQLCHLITVLSLSGEHAPWARMLTNGMRHP
jgi:AcrR family transcriptional regulator